MTTPVVISAARTEPQIGGDALEGASASGRRVDVHDRLVRRRGKLAAADVGAVAILSWTFRRPTVGVAVATFDGDERTRSPSGVMYSKTATNWYSASCVSPSLPVAVGVADRIAGE